MWFIRILMPVAALLSLAAHLIDTYGMLPNHHYLTYSILAIWGLLEWLHHLTYRKKANAE